MPRTQISRSPRRGLQPRTGSSRRALLRSRWVQAVLAATVAVQVGVAAHDHGAARTTPPIRAAQAASAPRADERTVASDSPRAAADSGADTTARRLAAEYRQKGFRVTDELARTIVSAAAGSGIGPDLAFGLVATESEFKRTARSPVGAIGLTQLMPNTARLFEPGTTADDLTDPDRNARIGFRFLSELIDHYRGDTATALTAYNRGPTRVDSILARGGDPDNGYAGKVMGD
jgi:soluble lytic murein transglycosylase-like protein